MHVLVCSMYFGNNDAFNLKLGGRLILEVDLFPGFYGMPNKGLGRGDERAGLAEYIGQLHLAGLEGS